MSITSFFSSCVGIIKTKCVKPFSHYSLLIVSHYWVVYLATRKLICSFIKIYLACTREMIEPAPEVWKTPRNIEYSGNIEVAT